jgi:hypothetical protein
MYGRGSVDGGTDTCRNSAPEYLPGPLRTTISDLQIIKFGFQGFDVAMSDLQVLVETVTFGDELS